MVERRQMAPAFRGDRDLDTASCAEPPVGRSGKWSTGAAHEGSGGAESSTFLLRPKGQDAKHAATFRLRREAAEGNTPSLCPT